jgi:hypothetical protein
MVGDIIADSRATSPGIRTPSACQQPAKLDTTARYTHVATNVLRTVLSPSIG